MTRHGRQRGPEKLISDMPSPSFRAQGRSRSAGTQVLRQTPTLSLFRDGDERTRLAGFQSPQQIEAAIALHL